METWTTVDKESWGTGVWEHEPDKAVWVDEETGLDCMIFRHPDAGHLCGYVGVPPDHPYHGIDYNQCPLLVREDDCPDRDEDDFCCEHEPVHRFPVHGGLTFANDCQEPTPEEWAAEFGLLSGDDLVLDRDDVAGLAAGVIPSFAEWRRRKMPQRICHTPEEGRPEDVWWFGFDCAHLGDVSPGHGREIELLGRGTYKTFDYVKGQVEDLAASLAAVQEV